MPALALRDRDCQWLRALRTGLGRGCQCLGLGVRASEQRERLEAPGLSGISAAKNFASLCLLSINHDSNGHRRQPSRLGGRPGAGRDSEPSFRVTRAVTIQGCRLALLVTNRLDWGSVTVTETSIGGGAVAARALGRPGPSEPRRRAALPSACDPGVAEGAGVWVRIQGFRVRLHPACQPLPGWVTPMRKSNWRCQVNYLWLFVLKW